MRMLHTSDWHLGRCLYDFSLLDDQEALLEQLLSLLKQERVDALVIAGDVYDRPVPSAAAIQLYDAFLSGTVKDLGIPVLAVAGNHDSASRLEFGSSLYSASGYYVCGQVRRDIRRVTLRDSHGPVEFWLAPYLHPADARSLFPDRKIRSFDDAWRVLLEENLPSMGGGRHVAVAHGFFSAIGGRDDKPLLTSDSEINVGGMDIADAGYFSPFTYTALGHLHASQRAGGEHIRYGGSPLKYSLSEERQHKCFTLVDLDSRGIGDIRTVPIKAVRDVRTIEGSLDQLLEPSSHGAGSFDDYVFATLTDEGALYPMEKLRTLFPHILGLRVQDSGGAVPQITLGSRAPRLSPTELFQRFYREVRGHDMPEDSLCFLQEAMEAGQREVETV